MSAGYKPVDDSALTWADLTDEERREKELESGFDSRLDFGKAETGLNEGMRLFRAWFVSTENAWGPLHSAFKAWGDESAREKVRELYSLAHGEEPAR